jgi:hypothetical protein
MNPDAPVAQLDRALPSEGKGHTFESCRVRHFRQTTLGYPRNALFSDPLAEMTSLPFVANLPIFGILCHVQ